MVFHQTRFTLSLKQSGPPNNIALGKSISAPNLAESTVKDLIFIRSSVRCVLDSD